jgi:hypothetical protein
MSIPALRDPSGIRSLAKTGSRRCGGELELGDVAVALKFCRLHLNVVFTLRSILASDVAFKNDLEAPLQANWNSIFSKRRCSRSEREASWTCG